MSISSIMQPVKLPADKTKAVTEALNKQDMKRKTPKSIDENFPLWETLINDAALVYIPNVTTTTESGQVVFDKGIAHTYAIKIGNQFLEMRSTQGLSGLDEYGISGQDPLQEAQSVNWDLYNLKVDAKAAELQVEPKSDLEAMKTFRRQVLDQFTVKQANLYYYFPIVEIKTNKGEDGTHDVRKIYTDGEGQISAKPYFFKVSEASYIKKFKPIEDTLMEGDTLGGKFYRFAYITGKETSELSNPKRDSGLAFTVTKLDLGENGAKIATALDAKVVEFTEEKAREVIISLMITDDAVHQDVADQAVRSVLDEIETLKALANAGINQGSKAGNPEDAMRQLGGGSNGQPGDQQGSLDISADSVNF